MSRHAQRTWTPPKFSPTHTSVSGNLRAMRIAGTGTLVTLMSEDGNIFTDFARNWTEDE